MRLCFIWFLHACRHLCVVWTSASIYASCVLHACMPASAQSMAHVSRPAPQAPARDRASLPARCACANAAKIQHGNEFYATCWRYHLSCLIGEQEMPCAFCGVYLWSQAFRNIPGTMLQASPSPWLPSGSERQENRGVSSSALAGFRKRRFRVQTTTAASKSTTLAICNNCL